jgi:hypothetical protein
LSRQKQTNQFSNTGIITTNTLDNSRRHKQRVGLPPKVWPECNNCLRLKGQWCTNPRRHVARCHLTPYFAALVMVVPDGIKPPLFSDLVYNLSCQTCVGRTLLQIRIHITGDTGLTKSHIYIFSQCLARSNHEPLQGNALALHGVGKEIKERENWRRN